MLNRKAIALVAGAMATALAGTSTEAQTFTGNGGTGFGGALGQGTLNVSSSPAGVVTFSFSSPVSFNSNDIVFFIDSTTGGVASTSTLTDVGDPGRRAISGLSDNGRTLVEFAPTFDADRAISFEPGFTGIFDLTNPANFTFVDSGNLSGAGTAGNPFTFSFDATELGLPATGGSFDFVATLISTTAFRSNETIGASTTTPGTPENSPNAGFTGTQTFSSFGTVTVVPEPASICLIGLGGLALLARRRRGC